LNKKRQHLTDQNAFRQSELDFMEKQGKQAKKDSNLANMIGLGKLGTDVFFAGKAAPAEAAKELTMGTGGQLVGAPGPTSFLGKAADYLKPNQGFGDLFGAGAGAGFGNALNLKNVAIGGGTGALASNLLTDEDDSKWKKAGIGAAAGGVSSYLASGGDLFSAGIGAAFGGGGGLFDFGF
jgi:hypothetical protein